MTTAKTVKINDTWLTIANYKEPLKAIPKAEGFGFYGTVLLTPDGDFIMCNVCGELRKNLAVHVQNSHRDKFPTTRDYKTHFGLAYTTVLVSETERQRMKQVGIDYWMSLSPAQKRKNKARAIAALNAINRSGRFQPKEQLETKNKKGTCPDQILEQIIKVQKELGHTPSKHEFIKAQGSQRYVHLIYKTFGSWSEALKLLKMEPHFYKQAYHGGHPEVYTDEFLLESLRLYVRANDKVPTKSDFKRGLLPSMGVFTKRFGSYETARQMAGLYDMTTNVPRRSLTYQRKPNYRDRRAYHRDYRNRLKNQTA